MARSFNGTSDRIDLANEANFDFERTQAFSGAFWIYPLAASLFGAAMAKQAGAGNNEGWIYGLDGGQFFAQLRSTGTSHILKQDDVAATVNAWTHVVWTYSGSSTAAGLKLYKNGVEDTTFVSVIDTLTTSILNNLVAQIGCRGGSAAPSFFLNAQVAEVGIWDVELTAEEAATLSRSYAPLLVRPQNLVSYLPLRGNVSPEQDVVGGNNGTLTGTTKADHPRVLMPGSSRAA